MYKLFLITLLTSFFSTNAFSASAKIIAYGFDDGSYTYQAICADNTRYRILKNTTFTEEQGNKITETCAEFISASGDKDKDEIIDSICEEGNINTDDFANKICNQ